MKKTNYLAWFFVATMMGTSFSACTNEAEEMFLQEDEIKLTSEITPSRVASLDYQSIQIVEGQQVGVTITGAKAEHKNVAWTVGTDGSLMNTGSPIYWGNAQATITAYHPYNSSWTGTNHTFSVKTDQSTNEGYLNSDLLWASRTGTKTDETVALTFTHKLAKVNVTLTSDDISDLSGATISICGTKTSTSFNPFTGELSSASNVANIKAGETTKEAYTAAAIIIPQTIVGGTQLIKVTHNNKNFYYKLSDDKEFKSGYSYSYTLKVKEKQVEVDLESGNITDWTDEDATGDAEEDVISAKSVTVTIAGTLSTLISDEEKDEITSLTISGPLNGDDLSFISEMHKVSHVNLNQAIVEKNIIRIYGKNINSLVIPNEIENLYLECENLSFVNIPNNIKNLSIINNKSIETINIPEGIVSVDLRECIGLTSINIPQGIEYIADNRNNNVVPEGKKWINLSGCASLSYVSIPNTVTTLGFNAFAGCTCLTYISIPQSVTTIGNQAFTDTGLITIYIPNTITNFDYGFTFNHCENLKELHLNISNPPYINEYTFHAVPLSTCKLYVPIGSKSKYQTANYWKNFGYIIEE